MTPASAHTDVDALRAARDAAVACDLAPLAVLAITGVDAPVFLQGQLSSDVKALSPGACQYTSCNSPKGRMLANFVLWRAADATDEFRALVPGDIAESLRKRLSMFVLRSKVALADVSAETARFGIGGPGGANAVRQALGVAPTPFAIASSDGATVLGLPGPRFVVLVPAAKAAAISPALCVHAVAAPFSVWQWLTIHAGVPVVTAATQDRFVAQTANWDVLGGISFQKGCYTGQEIIARTQYLGRLKERLFAFHANVEGVVAGARLFSAAFGDQPCGTVVNAAVAPEGGQDLLAVLQLAAAGSGEVHLHAPDGPGLSLRALPYSVPAPVEPRGRIA